MLSTLVSFVHAHGTYHAYWMEPNNGTDGACRLNGAGRTTVGGHPTLTPGWASKYFFGNLFRFAEVCRSVSLTRWRKGWDSTPRGSVNPLPVFKTGALNHSATLHWCPASVMHAPCSDTEFGNGTLPSL